MSITLKKVLVILILAISTTTWSQISQQFTQYYINQLPINPATAGKDNALDATFLYRAQWVGIKNSPSTQSFAVHSPLNIINSSAGLYVVNEKLGAERLTYLMLAYAYRLSLKTGKLAFGISGGAIQKMLDGTELRSPEGDYIGNFNHNDNLIPLTKQSDWVPEVNLGVYYNNTNLYVGVSVLNLIESKVMYETINATTQIGSGRTITTLAGYRIEINRELFLEPSVLLKTDTRQIQTDFSIIANYKHNIWGGMAFRGYSGSTKDAVALIMGVNVKNIITISYSYDFTVSELKTVSSGSHEIGLNYKMNIKELVKPGKIIYNPRYL